MGSKRAKLREMTLTADLVDLCAREEPDPGPNLDGRLTLIDDAGFRAFAERLVEEAGGGPLWVFAYGSLIWKPEFEAAESRRATAVGWHRSFCLEMVRWRGSLAQPGLMMALDRGGRCDGVIFRLPEEDLIAQIEKLLRREIDVIEDIYVVRWVTVKTETGNVRALAFWAGASGKGISRRLPLEQVARVLARACGHIGSCAEYLYNTVSHLEQQGIRDRNLWRLQELVATEIATLHGLEPATRKAG